MLLCTPIGILALASAVSGQSTVESYLKLNSPARERPHQVVALQHLTTVATLRRRLAPQGAAAVAPAVYCPDGSGVGEYKTEIEKHHWQRHTFWATEANFCEDKMGLWTSGCGVMCPLRALVIGNAVGLQPGQLVLDVGSGCGHFALWFHQFFGARTLGIDFVRAGVLWAQGMAERQAVPAQFCLVDLASRGLDWVPAGFADLAIAVSVLHYLKTDKGRWEAPPRGQRQQLQTEGQENITATRSSCARLRTIPGTQCSVARQMYRTVKVGGTVWVAHNGSYKRKWDPKHVWGPNYWKCCFSAEVESGAAEVKEVPELDIFMNMPDWDPTYSVIVLRLW